MAESASASEGLEALSTRDRLTLIHTLNVLPRPQFAELVLAINPPKGHIKDNSVPQGIRIKALLDWVEGPIGPGLAALESVLKKSIPNFTKTADYHIAFTINGQIRNDTTTKIQAFIQLLRKKTRNDSIDVAFFMESNIKLDLSRSPEDLEKFMTFVINRKISSSSTVEVQAFVQLLRKKTRDDSLDIAFLMEGGFTLILSGSPEGLEMLQILFELGKLEDLKTLQVVDIFRVDNWTTAARKARLIQSLRLHKQPSTPARAFKRTHAFKRAFVLALVIVLIISFNRAPADTLLITIAITSAIAIAFLMDLAHFRNFAFDFVHDLARSHPRLLTRDLARELRNADLRGANLKDIDFRKVDLRGADLTSADVTGTIFGDNIGLTEEDKHDLKRRGAIFQDPALPMVSNPIG